MKTVNSVGMLLLYEGALSGKAVVDVTSQSWSKPVELNSSGNKGFY